MLPGRMEMIRRKMSTEQGACAVDEGEAAVAL